MGSGLVALFLAAGVAGFVYSKMGRRVGYGNSQNVWTLVAVTFVLVFIATFVLLKFTLNLNG